MRSKKVRRILKPIKFYVALRTAEFVIAVAALTLVTFLSPGEDFCELRPDECITGMEGLIDVISLFAGFSLYWIIASYYLVFMLLLFLGFEFAVGITPKNIPYLNSLPYAFYALPTLLGYFGGEPSLNLMFWPPWFAIIVFNFFAPRLLFKEFRVDKKTASTV